MLALPDRLRAPLAVGLKTRMDGATVWIRVAELPRKVLLPP
jgi:hypothetical protein